MAIKIRKSSNYIGGAGVKLLGTLGGMKMRSLGGGAGGGGGTGTALDPYVLLTDGTPLLFTIDSSVIAEYRQFDNGGAPHYGKYATFVCPVMSPGDTLRIRFGVQTDSVDSLDTYMYLFEGSTFVLGGETLIDQDDDGGSGYYDVFENTLLEIPEGTLTAGQPYILELTTYSVGNTSNVKVIADVVVPVATGITLTNGMVVTPVVEGGTYAYNDGDSVTLDTTNPLKNVSIAVPLGFFLGTMPVDLSTVGFPSSDIYSVSTEQGVSFSLDVTVTPPEGLVFSQFVSQVITGGESVSFTSFGPIPGLTTTLVDTSWTLKDQFDSVIDTGTLPINNLKILWANNFLSSGEAYTMVASGITFTITRAGGFE